MATKPPPTSKPHKQAKWATVKGSTGSGADPNVQSSTKPTSCLISWPNTSLPLVGSVGGGCLLSKTNVRAWLGGGLMLVGGMGMLPAVILLAAAGFGKTRLGQEATNVVGMVPLPAAQGVAAGLRTAGSGSTAPIGREVRNRRQSRAREERTAERRLGEPKENPNLRTGKGAVRETKAGTRARKREAANDKPPF